MNELSKVEIILEVNKKTLYSISWKQVSDSLGHSIHTLKNFKTMKSEADMLGLLTALCNQSFNSQSQKDQALQEAIWQFYLISQGNTNSSESYMDSYGNRMQEISYIYGKLPMDTNSKWSGICHQRYQSKF